MEIISEPDPDDEGTKISVSWKLASRSHSHSFPAEHNSSWFSWITHVQWEKGGNQGNQWQCIISAKVVPFLLQKGCSPFYPLSAALRVSQPPCQSTHGSLKQKKCHIMELNWQLRSNLLFWSWLSNRNTVETIRQMLYEHSWIPQSLNEFSCICVKSESSKQRKWQRVNFQLEQTHAQTSEPSAWQVPNGFLTGSQHAPNGFPTGSRLVPNVFRMGSRLVLNVFPTCSRLVPDLFPTCSRQVPDLFPTCSRQIPDLFPSCSQCVPGRFPTCSRLVPNMISSGFRHVPNRFPTCSQHVLIRFPDMFPTGSRHVPDRFHVFPIFNTSQTRPESWVRLCGTLLSGQRFGVILGHAHNFSFVLIIECAPREVINNWSVISLEQVPINYSYSFFLRFNYKVTFILCICFSISSSWHFFI